MSVIAIDLGGTKIAGAVFTESGSVVKQSSYTLSGKTGKDVGQLILKLIHSLSYSLKEEIKAVGICVPGIANSRTGRIWAPNIPGWEDYPLKSEMEDYFSGTSVRISIESDRTCYILGEVWKGAAKGCSNAIYISVGTGIGAGIMIDGRILHGSNDIVGATGWMALQSPFSEDYIDCGCFEYYSSGRGIVQNAGKMVLSSPDYQGVLKKIEELTTRNVFEAYGMNDPIAMKVIQKAIEMWGMAAANFVSLFNPEKIIFGGGVFGPAVQFLDDIRNEAAKWAQPVSMKSVKFESSTLAGNAGLLGAAFMALDLVKEFSKEI